MKQLAAECKEILKVAELFDRAHGWTWVVLVFGVVPIVLAILSHILFDTMLYPIIEENLGTLYIFLLIIIAIFFYTRYKCSEEYDKLFAKQRELNALEVLTNGEIA